MRAIPGIAAFGVAILLAGCAVHPLTEDVTREASYTIIQKIRCEAREALKAISLDILRRSSPNPRLQALLDQAERDELLITDLFNRKKAYYGIVPPAAHAVFAKFALATVGMDFTFDITETNDNQFDSNFRDPFSTGLFSLNGKAGMKLDREGKRQVQIVDTFIELHELLKPQFCAEIAAGQGHFIYPITGKIGLYEALLTFVKLQESSNVVKKYTDNLIFTTTLTASAAPKIELNPLSSSVFRLANASLSSNLKRQDIHSVLFTIEMGKPVTSLVEAEKLANIQKQSVLRTLDELRTENFFSTLNNLERRLDQQTQ